MPLHPTLQPCCTPAGSMRLRSLRRPDASHSAGLVTISVNRSDNPLSYFERLILVTRFTLISAHLKNGRDEHGVCVGKAEEGGLGVGGLFKTFEGPNHSGVLYRRMVEIQLDLWIWMVQRTKGIFLNALSICSLVPPRSWNSRSVVALEEIRGDRRLLEGLRLH